MGETSLLSIFITALLIQNVALYYLLGMCPFVALSRSLTTAFGMGAAVIFVVALTSSANWAIYQLLEKTGSQIIQYIVFIIVIAACVQLVEMIMERFFPSLQASFGIFLPLITVNCTVLFIFLLRQLLSKGYHIFKPWYTPFQRQSDSGWQWCSWQRFMRNWI